MPEEFPTDEEQEKERLRLFALISELVLWESTTNEEVLERAREEIRRSWRRCCIDNADHPEAAELFDPQKLPGFHDPFAGGGALPLEAQRLGLESCATDLNPVAVLINKAMIEIPPKFAGMPPVNPESRRNLDVRHWKGAQGLAEDVRYYGQWIRDQAVKRLGRLYPKARITSEMVALRPDLKSYERQELPIVAWIWARTVKCPNPSFSDVDVPLMSTFMLSTKASRQSYVVPVVTDTGYSFEVKTGTPENVAAAKSGTKLSRANFRCVMTGDLIHGDYIKSESEAGRMGKRLIALVAEGRRERVYLSPAENLEAEAESFPDNNLIRVPISGSTQYLGVKPYGMETFDQLFTSRQLLSLVTFTELIGEASELAAKDGEDAGLLGDLIGLKDNGAGATAYSEAISIYLSFALDKLADRGSTICTWFTERDSTRNTFGRQAIPMTWDFAELNVLLDGTGTFSGAVAWTSESLEGLVVSSQSGHSIALQMDAQNQNLSKNRVVSTDPPYYDNVPYSDLSDFFYVWLRCTQKKNFPDLFATMTSPKTEELVAFAHRHSERKQGAEEFFLKGMQSAMSRISGQAHPAFPVTIYYAFKQSELKSDKGIASTGWETFLEAVIRAGMSIIGTLPMRTELSNRMRGMGSNALATSVVLVCRPRTQLAHTLSRNEFRRQLRKELPRAVQELERANIAPVDVAQAAIGPGMAIFSAARAVLHPDDSSMSVRDALIEINIALDEYLSHEEGAMDAETRFALTFYESFGYQERDYGDAESLAVARNISVDGVAKAGILRSVAGKVRLLQRCELPEDWDPISDKRLCVWEATQQLIKRLETGGEKGAAALLLQLKNVPGHGDLAANCRALAYRLYNHCEKTKQAEEARSYNGLVIAWPELERQASAAANAQSAPHQPSLI